MITVEEEKRAPLDDRWTAHGRGQRRHKRACLWLQLHPSHSIATLVTRANNNQLRQQ